MAEKIPRIRESQVQLGRRAVAGDMGGGSGLQALGQATEQVGGIAFQLFEQEMDSVKSRSIVDSTREMNDLYLEVEKLDHNIREESFSDGAQKIIKAHREKLQYPKYQEDYDLEISNVLERRKLNIGIGIRKDQLAVIGFNNSAYVYGKVKEYEDAEYATPEELALIQNSAFEKIDSSVNGGTMSPQLGASTRNLIAGSFAKADFIRESKGLTRKLIDEYGTDYEAMFAIAEGTPGKLGDDVVKRILDHMGATKRSSEALATAEFDKWYWKAMSHGLDDATGLLDKLKGAGVTGRVSKMVMDIYGSRNTGESEKVDWVKVSRITERVNAGEWNTSGEFLRDSRVPFGSLGKEVYNIVQMLDSPLMAVKKSKSVNEQMKIQKGIILNSREPSSNGVPFFGTVNDVSRIAAHEFETWFWKHHESISKKQKLESIRQKTDLALIMLDPTQGNEFYVGVTLDKDGKAMHRPGNPYNNQNVNTFILNSKTRFKIKGVPELEGYQPIQYPPNEGLPSDEGPPLDYSPVGESSVGESQVGESPVGGGWNLHQKSQELRQNGESQGNFLRRTERE